MKNKNTVKIFTLDMIFLLISVGCVFSYCFFLKQELYICVEYAVFTGICLLISDFCFRNSFLDSDEFKTEKLNHIYRYYHGLLVGLLLSFICKYIPAASWPFVPLFLYLSIFYTPLCSIVNGITFLTIAMLLSGFSFQIFVMYLICGIFAVCLFQNFDGESKVGFRLFLLAICMFVCIFCGAYLTLNSKLNIEFFIYPFVNIIITIILVLCILKFYSTSIVFKIKNVYLDLNDVEYPYLADFKKNNLKQYMSSIHTEHFCERISLKLNLDTDILKCIAYYHKLISSNTELLDEIPFPQKSKEILTEYLKKDFRTKESAILYCSDTCVYSIQYMFSQKNSGDIDYDKIIDSVFLHINQKDLFKNCDLTCKELTIIKSIFKEEKLYYDFLR